MAFEPSRSPRIADHFASLTDPRRKKVTHPLINIITIVLCGSIAGADHFVTMTNGDQLHKNWLAQFLDLSNGIPSHDLLNSLFRRLNPKEFERCLLSWLAALPNVGGGKLIAIDGKTLRSRFDTAMPELLKLLELAGAIVTIDAMGCQTKIAAALVEKGGHSILAVKRDKPTLSEGIEAFFLEHMDDDFGRTQVSRHETKERGHGQTEHRTYDVCDVPADWPEAKRWQGLKWIGLAISDTVRDGKACDDVRYFILSQEVDGPSVRDVDPLPLGIENSLHWQLDVSFGEDKDRTRKDHASANLGVLRRTALSLLKRETTAKVGIKNKRLAAGWNTEYLRKVRFGA